MTFTQNSDKSVAAMGLMHFHTLIIIVYDSICNEKNYVFLQNRTRRIRGKAVTGPVFPLKYEVAKTFVSECTKHLTNQTEKQLLYYYLSLADAGAYRVVSLPLATDCNAPY